MNSNAEVKNEVLHEHAIRERNLSSYVSMWDSSLIIIN